MKKILKWISWGILILTGLFVLTTFVGAMFFVCGYWGIVAIVWVVLVAFALAFLN